MFGSVSAGKLGQKQQDIRQEKGRERIRSRRVSVNRFGSIGTDTFTILTSLQAVYTFGSFRL